VQAQITVNSENVVGVGSEVINASDFDGGGLTIGPGGANLTWDYSSLNEDELDSVRFTSPANLPGSIYFPNSNLVLEDSDEEGDGWIYATKNNAKLSMDGYAMYDESGDLETGLSPSTIITFPSTMGTSYSNSSYQVVGVIPVGIDIDGVGPTPVIDSIRITSSFSESSEIDAWGNLTTPSGTFESLRQVVLEERIDTTWMTMGGSGVWEVVSPTIASLFDMESISTETIRIARWWTNEPGMEFPVVEVEYDADGTVDNVDWLKTTLSVGIGQKMAQLTRVSVYPNPAKNEITLEADLNSSNARIELIDITGRVMVSEAFTSERITLSLSNIKNGIYFYQISDDKGQILSTNKFVVAK
jgi:hypothetical protein